MKEKKRRQNRQEIKLLLLCILIFGIMVAGTSFYLNTLMQSLWTQSVTQVLEVTVQGQHALVIYNNKGIETLDGLSGKLAEKRSDEVTEIQNTLNLFGKSEGDYALIDLENRLVYYNQREGSYKLGEEWLEVCAGLGESGILRPYVNANTGESVLGYYKRFMFRDGRPGIVLKEQLLSTISNEFSLSFYDNAGFSYIVDSNGDILIRSEHPNSNSSFRNLFEMIETSDENADSLEEFRRSLTEGKQGVGLYQFDEEKYVVAYVPIGETPGWYVISLIPDRVVMDHINSVMRSSRIFIFVIAAGLFFVGLSWILVRHNRKDVQEKEREIQLQEKMFEILASNMDDVFLMIDAEDFSVEYVSPNVERVLGFSVKTVKENLAVIGDAKYAEGEEVTWDALSKLVLGDSIVRESERIHKQTGSRRYFTEIAYRVAVGDDNKFLVILSDRTLEHKNKLALEEALDIAKAANESKSAFLSNMSHDIRTPMNAIMGLSVLLQRDAGNQERVLDHTRKIMVSSQHLLSLINDVLDMSKIESGKTTLNISEFHLSELINEVSIIIRQQAKAKQQQFDIAVQNITTEHLLGDRLRINQILINILSNAVKYTGEGGRIELTVRQLEQRTKNYARLQFVVKDNGIGMSQEYLAELFDPFSRGNSHLTNKVQGAGLGMAITKNLIDLMGGTIRVESALDRGSTFTVNLELRIMEQDIDPHFWEKHGISHMLVVDNEESVCAGVISTMSGTGVSMEYALNGTSAVTMIRTACEERREFDLVLLDWQMPEMDGLETARHIREVVPDNIPIIILTSYDWSDIEKEALLAGVDGFLPKPFFLNNFMDMVDKLRKEEEKDGGRGLLKTAGAEENSSMKGKYFLAAEDNDLNAEILVELLDMKGAKCDLAVNGKEVYEMFTRSEPGKYDMILMDIQMPVMDGYNATMAIRASSHPQASTIPIVAMTANAFANDVKDAMDAGMNAHIAKPVNMEQLEVTVRDLLTEHVHDV